MSDSDAHGQDESSHEEHHDDDHDHHDDDHDHHDDDHDHHDDDHDHHHDDHDHHHDHDADSVAIAVVTVSSSRSLGDGDASGEYIVSAFESAGHEVVVRELVPDEYDSVQGAVDQLARRKDTDAVVTNGGTGVTPDDVTPEAVRGLFAKRLPGFGELFRQLSYEEIGTRTIGSRATAGIVSETPVFCLPGSENAVRLGVDEVILPEVCHLVGLASRGAGDDDDTDEN